MLTIENKLTQVDDLLERMTKGLQLDKSRYGRMIQSYEAVKNWIDDDEVFFKPFRYDVYPHGSVRTGTTVKPFGSFEFDLDIVIHLLPGSITHTPARIYAELKRRLLEHGTYKEMIELKNRCIRLNYAGDFHMDILPGVQESQWDNNRLKVPDRDLNAWVSSNPRGHADWFLQRANTVNKTTLKRTLMAENLPVDDFDNKKPLQCGVQLIKRYRDLYFLKDDTYKTSSIIITTLCGQLYTGEDSIFGTIDAIISKIISQVRISSGCIKVLNPVNADEDFTDKWEAEPAYYTAFKNFSEYLYVQWQKLKGNHGVIEESLVMKSLFGEDVVVRAQTQQTEAFENLRKQNALGVNRNTGAVVAATSLLSNPIKKINTFFGD